MDYLQVLEYFSPIFGATFCSTFIWEFNWVRIWLGAWSRLIITCKSIRSQERLNRLMERKMWSTDAQHGDLALPIVITVAYYKVVLHLARRPGGAASPWQRQVAAWPGGGSPLAPIRASGVFLHKRFSGFFRQYWFFTFFCNARTKTDRNWHWALG